MGISIFETRVEFELNNELNLICNAFSCFLFLEYSTEIESSNDRNIGLSEKSQRSVTQLYLSHNGYFVLNWIICYALFVYEQ